MIRLLPASACVLVALLSTGLAAQDNAPACPRGESEDDGIGVSVVLDVHPTRVAASLDSLLETGGWEVRRSPQSTGAWSIAPRFTYPDEVKDEAWVQHPHPGVMLRVGTEARGDSTLVEVGARLICNPASGKPEDDVSPLTLLSATMLVAELTTVMDTLEAHGVDLRAPVPRAGFSLPIPDSVGDFAFVRREDFDDPRLGTSVRYGREADGMYFDVYVYPGPPANEKCPVSCAETRVMEETQSFIDSAPDFIQRGYFRRMDVKRNEAVTVPNGAAYRAGRHLVMEVVRGQGSTEPLESQFILYSFPGYMVKARVTYAPSPEMEGTVRTFVANLLQAFVPR